MNNYFTQLGSQVSSPDIISNIDPLVMEGAGIFVDHTVLNKGVGSSDFSFSSNSSKPDQLIDAVNIDELEDASKESETSKSSLLQQSHNTYESELPDLLIQQILSITDGLPEWDDWLDERLVVQLTDEHRFIHGLLAFLELMQEYTRSPVRCSHEQAETLVANIDLYLSRQLDEILHAPEFQRVESTWRSLYYLVGESAPSIQLDVLHYTKQDCADDISNKPINKTWLYQCLYTQAYDMPGATPYSSWCFDNLWSSTQGDIQQIEKLAEVSALAHCPMVSAVSAKFFMRNTMAELNSIADWGHHFQRAHYVHWRAFRNTDAARYISLTMPGFLLRPLYGEDKIVRQIPYAEQICVDNCEDLLWGNAAYALCANMCQSMLKQGWPINIRGPRSGGCVQGLPLPKYKAAGLIEYHAPTEISISESREVCLSKQGFIPLSYYAGTNYACFFSANTCQVPTEYDDNDATANSRANTRLPYVLLCSRLAHHLKVMQRENIGAASDPVYLQNQLQRWIQGYVTQMNQPDAAIMARFPLREAHVEVHSIADNPGYFSVSMSVVPHFQLEGMSVKLSLVSRLPRSTTIQ